MRSFPLALALASFTGLGCAPAAGPPPIEANTHLLSHVVRVTEDNPLLSYAWDAGLSVPSSAGAGELAIDFGERGRDERTRLYETFEEGSVAGRFGRALRVEQGTRRRFEGANLFEPPFVLSFWVAPDKAAKGEIILRAGPLMVQVLEDGQCRARLDVEPPLNVRAGPLYFGEWNHVAVALDGPELQQLRIVVNGVFDSGAVQARIEFDPDQALVMGREFVGAIDDLSIRGYPVSTADLLDRGTMRAASGAHELVLEFANGTETRSLWAGAVTEPVLTDWQSGELRHAVHDDGGLRRVPGHWERIPAKDPPLARTTHPTIYVGGNRVFIFGGETRDTHAWVWKNTNDTWIFHTKEGRWERIETDVHPEPSCHQPAAYSPDHGYILYPGGWRNDVDPYVKYDDVWRFYPDEGRWEKREPKGIKAFPKLSNCALTYHPGLKLFFLFTAGQPRAIVYDPETDLWSRRPPYKAFNEAGEEVEYRTHGSPMTGYDPQSGNIVVYGGGRGAEEHRVFHDTTAVYDPKTNRFAVLDMAQAPSPRVRSGFAYDSKRDHFVLFGGVQDHASQRNDDLWVLDPRKKEWRRIAASNSPGERGGYYAMAYDPDLDRFFLLCGRAGRDRFLDEAWSLSLDEQAVGEATYVFDRAGFAEREWFAETSTPGDASITFRFRSTDEPGSWGAWTEIPDASARYLMVQAFLAPGSKGEEPTVTALGFR